MPWRRPGSALTGHALARPGVALVAPGLAGAGRGWPGLAGAGRGWPGLAGASMGGPCWRRHFGGTPRRIASVPSCRPKTFSHLNQKKNKYPYAKNTDIIE
jgi:hypothetical protein